ncbi:CHAP domain-containing protein [Actinomadura sp. SCN-SB]|uniref:CHAP domain-containing protein n=1 Tax=Actinomadura sp. SCN-SB TaxID=3373092 RepID=UPI003752F6F0
MSFRENLSYTTLLASARERTTYLTSQTLSLRGRAAAGAVGAAALGALTFGSAAAALADAGPQEVTTTAAVAGQAVGAGNAGEAAGLRPEQLPEKGERLAEKTETKATKEFAGKEANAAESSTVRSAAAANDVIELAKDQVGITEGKDGNTKFHKWYISSDAAQRTAERDGGSVSDYKGAQWCDMFISWVGEQTGARGMGADAYTVSHAEWFKDNDRWGTKARPGAVVFFNFDGDKSIGSIEHVGLVDKVNGDGTISTIEGNSNDAVEKRIRDNSEVVGYGYPEYRK